MSTIDNYKHFRQGEVLDTVDLNAPYTSLQAASISGIADDNTAAAWVSREHLSSLGIIRHVNRLHQLLTMVL